MALNTIWKFALKMVDRQKIMMPAGACIMSAGLDPVGDLCIWASVDRNEVVKREVEIMIVGPGNALPHIGDFIGTVTMGGFVRHVFTGPGDMKLIPSYHYQTKGNAG